MKSFGTAAAILAVVAVLSLGLAGRATASHFTGACAAELNAVEAALGAAGFVNEVDRTNLLAKLAAAAAKVEGGKFADAVDKLLDISDKATALATATKPKLDADSASAINAAVEAAIGCVGGL